MTAYAVLNEESLRTGDPRGDSSLLLALMKTFLALREQVAIHDQERVQVYVTKEPYRISLPSGAKLPAALGALGKMSPDMARRLQRILANNAQTFDEQGNATPAGTTEVTFSDAGSPREAPALRAAWLLRGLAWSAGHADWQSETIPVLVRDAPGAVRNERLANAYRPEIGPSQRAVLTQHVTVLPDFDADDRRHDPTHASYIQGKSHIPKHADQILRYAVPVEGGMTWWAKCACGFYHRFQGSQQQQEQGRSRVHWNGTTNPEATGNRAKGGVPTSSSHIPPSVIEALARNATLRALGEADCGCRERS